MNQHMVIIACVQTPPSPQETSIFPEGRAGGSVHRLGHKKENTVTYFRAAFLAQHQPPCYGLLTQTHFQIAWVYWWRFFFFAVYRICWSFSLVPRRPRWFRMCRQLSNLLGEFGSQPLPLTLARTGLWTRLLILVQCCNVGRMQFKRNTLGVL